MASPDLLPAYAELHCLSNFSFLRGASHPEELVERAQGQGYAALALTDECSLAGVVRAHLAAKDAGLPLIIGSEFTLADGTKLVLLATDRASYGDLSQLITRGRRNAAKGTYAADARRRRRARVALPRAVAARARFARAPMSAMRCAATPAGCATCSPTAPGSPSSCSRTPATRARLAHCTALSRHSRLAARRRRRRAHARARAPRAAGHADRDPPAARRSPNAATRSTPTASGICARARGSRTSIRPRCSPRR